MAPPSSATARRATAAPQARPASRRPALRVVQPERRRATRAGRTRRTHVWLAVGMVVASLLFVVVGDTMVAQGQVRLAKIQLAIGAQQAAQKAMQTEVAQLAAPDRVVAQGIALGLTAPAQVVNLPEVPLDVPLPVPDTSPSGARTTATTPAATTPATTTPAPASARSTAASTPATATTPITTPR
jgi:hypothetical protein